MKTLLTLPLLLLSLVSFPSWSDTVDALVVRDGLYYEKFSDVPFTGRLEGLFQGFIKNGKKEGLWITYYSYGQMWSKGEYKNGKEEGPWVIYWGNGHLSGEGEYRNGKKEGPWVFYWINGELLGKGDHRNGKKEGPWVFYWDDGETWNKRSGVYKDDVKVRD